MRKIVECVPNFSEGKRKEIIDKIVSAILSIPDIFLLDVEMNQDHNRSVITFIGEPEGCLEAAFLATKKASELIDLNKHKGEHPRIGATDVIPFVPISGISMEECVLLAKKLGKKIADELNIPVYLYEQAATRPDRVDLANIRKGEFEGLKEAIEKDPERAPDFGKPKIHPTAGATVVGARFPLIAYNINLNTKDLSIAKNIAKRIRFKDGGLRYVKALGFEIKEKECVQVSINMTNYEQTPLYQVFEMTKRECERYGVMVKESEIIGLVPLKALIDTAIYYLQLFSFKEEQILEMRLPSAKSLASFISDVASSSPTPGGGAVSALSANIGTSLILKVCNLTIGKKGYLEYEEKMKELKSLLDVYAQRFYNLIQLDCDAFNKLISAFKLKKEDEEREKKIEEALKEAINIPHEVMEKSLEVLRLSSFICEYGNKNAISDCGVGINLLYSAIKGAYHNVLINLGNLKDEGFKRNKKEEGLKILKEGEEVLKGLEDKVLKRLIL